MSVEGIFCCCQQAPTGACCACRTVLNGTSITATWTGSMSWTALASVPCIVANNQQQFQQTCASVGGYQVSRATSSLTLPGFSRTIAFESQSNYLGECRYALSSGRDFVVETEFGSIGCDQSTSLTGVGSPRIVRSFVRVLAPRNPSANCSSRTYWSALVFLSGSNTGGLPFYGPTLEYRSAYHPFCNPPPTLQFWSSTVPLDGSASSCPNIPLTVLDFFGGGFAGSLGFGTSYEIVPGVVNLT